MEKPKKILTEEQKEEKRRKRREYQRKYYVTHKELIRENNRKSEERNGKNWKTSDPEYRRVKALKAYHKRHSDPDKHAKYLETKRLWEANRRRKKHQAVRDEWNTWRRNNRDRYNEQRREYCNDPDRKKSISSRKKKRKLLVKEQAIDMYGGCCVCCGEDHIAFLAIDHVNNDGGSKRKTGEHGCGDGMYRMLISLGKRSPEFQILCFNCNWGKARYGECPHKLVANEILFPNTGASV